MAELPLRPNVCMLVLNRERKLLLGQRHGEPGVWQFPQGGVEQDASLQENVLRELTEELGAPREKFRIITRLKSTNEYEWKTPPPAAVGRWRGQSQTFWLVDFSGQDSDFYLCGDHPELQAVRWCSIEEVKSLAEPIRVAGYLGPLKEVEEYLVGLRV